MDYEKIYNQLIEKGKLRNLDKERGFHIHHIIPKSLGGGNEKENKVKLTYKEHFIAHELLWKFTKDPKMIQALFFMSIRKKDYWKCSPRTYEKLCKEFSIKQSKKMKLKNNFKVFYGEDNPMYGRCAYAIWVERYGEEEADKRKKEAEKKKSLSSKGEKHWLKKMKKDEYEDHCNKKLRGNNNPHSGITTYEQMIKKYGKEEADKRNKEANLKNAESVRKSKLGRICINNSFKEKYIYGNELDKYLEQGWELGRPQYIIEKTTPKKKNIFIGEINAL